MTKRERNKAYEQDLLNRVELFMKEKYKDVDVILCYFDIYIIRLDMSKNMIEDRQIVQLTKDDYARLLTLFVEHPNLSFCELPLHISKKLYKELLTGLHFYVKEKVEPSFLPEVPLDPIAVDMVTLREDALEILGEDYSGFIAKG